VSLPGARPRALRVGDGLATTAIPLTLQPAATDLEARLELVYELLERSAGKKGLRGGVLGVSYEGQEMIRTFGQAPAAAAGSAERKDADFEASLSALPNVPLLTTAIARLVEVKQLSLETPLTMVLQGTSPRPPAEGWRGVTVRQILEHTSGLEPVHARRGAAGGEWLRFAAGPARRDTFPFVDATIEGLILRTLTGRPNLTGPEEMILDPIRPAPGAQAGAGAALSSADLRSAVRARDALILGQLWLNGGIYNHRRLLSRKTVEQFVTQKNVGNATYTAGWEVSLAPGHSWSPHAFGFTASEGPSLWMDPTHQLCVVFLPDTSAKPMGEAPPGDAHMGPLRAEIHDAIYAALVLRK
jgi:CubicO group peptidase (beta-lactamase class C family)